LSCYFNVLPIAFPMNDILRFLHLLLFFPLAYILALKLGNAGLSLYGVVFYQGWLRNLLKGFSIGFCFWGILFALYFVLGRYEFEGFNPLSVSLRNIFVVIIGYGLGSLINDMIVRGYLINRLKGKFSLTTIFTLSILVYALDDIWFAGFSIQNTIFSAALGLSLTYSFIKANSIWLNTGIHYGLNVLYGLFFGVSQQAGGGIFLFSEGSSPGILSFWLSTIISILMFFAVVFVSRFINVYHAEGFALPESKDRMLPF
jgi:hypothetical protein